MKDDIVAKLKTHLSVPVDTECAVVYLLVEVRKLLGMNQPNRNLSTLSMYCHWAVHVDLTHAKTTGEFLEKIDCFVRNKVHGFEADGKCSFNDEQDLFRDFSSLDTFRGELSCFLNSYDLPTSLCDDTRSWHRFISAYASVIEAGTLSAGKVQETKAIKEVTFTKLPSSENDALFGIQWDVKLTNGKTLRAVCEAKYDLRMVCHDLSLLPAEQAALAATAVRAAAR